MPHGMSRGDQLQRSSHSVPTLRGVHVDLRRA
jgi:hypothetical protein